jgi:tRNA U55 pseudouridine synthase TruB
MVDALLPAFLGTRLQRPPNISAVHVEGKRAHAIARSGETPHIAAKPVSIYSLRRTSAPDPQGRISFEVLCSKGTYVRSLARDMGERLGVGGHVESLTRSTLGLWNLSEALPLRALEERNPAEREANLEWLTSVCRSPLEAARHYSLFTCSEDLLAERLRHGNPVPFRELSRRSWGSLAWRSSLVVHLPESLVFGNLKTSETGESLFVPRGKILLEEDLS